MCLYADFWWFSGKKFRQNAPLFTHAQKNFNLAPQVVRDVCADCCFSFSLSCVIMGRTRKSYFFIFVGAFSVVDFSLCNHANTYRYGSGTRTKKNKKFNEYCSWSNCVLCLMLSHMRLYVSMCWCSDISTCACMCDITVYTGGLILKWNSTGL